jgi:chromosome segregation ATPase
VKKPNDVMIKNLPNQLSELINKSDVFDEIATKAADPNESLAQLKTFDETSLKKIAEFMPVINEKTNVFGRTNSFTANKLMTLQMLSRGSSMRVLRQCLSQIERKRAAVKETLTKLKKDQLKAKKLLGDIEDLDFEIKSINEKIKEIEDETWSTEEDLTNIEKKRKYKKELRNLNYEKELLKIELEEIQTNAVETRTYLEGAFKEIASFQDAYKQIIKNKGIKED